MITKKQNVLLWCVYGSITIMVVVSFFCKSTVRVALSYSAQTNQNGQCTAFFTVSNAGNVPIAFNSLGNLEFFEQSTGQIVRYDLPSWELQPDNCETSQVYLPFAMKQPWRFTIRYQQIGARQWKHVSSDWINQPPIATVKFVP